MSKPLNIILNNKNEYDSNDGSDSSYSSNSNSPLDKPRCFVCNKRLNLIEQTSGNCKCGKIFCNRHRSIQTKIEDLNSHRCSIDIIKQNHKKFLETKNPKMLISRLTQI